MSSISKIIKNTALNLGGLGLPMIVAFFSIPYLIHVLGAEKFGLLALIWAVVSYVGVFDLGLGRALTIQVAMYDAKNLKEELGRVIGTAYSLMFLLGVLLAVLMFLFTPAIVDMINGVSDVNETESSFMIMALAVPFIIMTSGFKGILEARHEFAKVNYVRLPLGVFTFAGPAALAFFIGARLDLIAGVLVLGRVAGCFAYFVFAFGAAYYEHKNLAWNRVMVKKLCASGGWLSVANVISPVMGYADRFFLGALISVTAVAYYVTPNEIVTKLWIIPGALTAVLFPIFSSNSVSDVKKTTVELFDFSSRIVYLCIAPVSLILAVFSFELLEFWVGEEFAREGQGILVIFSFAILVNCLAHVPLTLLQGVGSAKKVALLQIAEIPIFIVVLWILTLNFGVIGAAWAWVIRAVFDTGMLLKFAAIKMDVGFWGRASGVLAGLVTQVLVYFAIIGFDLKARILVTVFVCAIFLVLIMVLFIKAPVLKTKMQH